MSACDVVDNWDETAYSGEGGRLEQLEGVVGETMESYGFEPSDVAEKPGLMESEGVPAEYDPETDTIYFDSDYLASDEISAEEGVYLAIHESVHAMDALEDGSLDVGELDVADAAFGMTGDATGECDEPPDSGGGGGGDGGGEGDSFAPIGGDTGGW